MNPLRTFSRSLAGAKSFNVSPFWSRSDGESAWPYLFSWGKPDQERIENDFEGYVRDIYKSDGIVWACIATRQSIFAQARFQWVRYVDGSPGRPFGSPELKLLERPWPGGTTGELLARADLDVSLSGNFWATTADDNGRFGHASRSGPNRRIVHMRPDWVTMVIDAPSGNPNALDARTVAISYKPPTANGKDAPEVLLLPSEVCHYSPYPDPIARYRGMSWLTPVVREIQADKAATKHKLKFFQNAATPNLAVSLPKEVSPEQFESFVAKMKKRHKGVEHAYETLYTAGGADVTVVGADMKQLDFKSTQGHGETRIAADAGVHPVIVALSEGMQGSSLNAGNFNAARRLSADKSFRYWWQVVAASLQNLLELPQPTEGVELNADLRQVSFLQEDRKDQAEIRAQNAVALRGITDAGFDPDSAVEYLATDDLTVLKGRHSGLFSVQLQEPGQGDKGGDARNLVEMLQKVYLAVGTVITVDEARAILNRAGAGLPVTMPNTEGT